MLKRFLCAATLIATAGYASAASMTTNYTIPKEPTPVASSLDVAQFDDMMGTLKLESVMFSFSGSIETQITIINPLAEDQDNIGYTVNGNLVLNDGMNVSLLTLPTINGTIDVAASATVETGLLTSSDSIMETYTDMGTLAAFTGTGLVSLSFDADASSTFSGTGNIFTQVLTDAYGSVDVTYTYSTIPVSAPAHVALLGLGLVAFAGYRKVRK